MPENRNPFNRGDIEYIAAQFLVRPVGVKKFRGGTANTSYLINSLSGKFVLTVLECHDELTARRLIDILVHVCHHGVCTGHPVETSKGEYCVTHRGRPVILKTYVPGKCNNQFPDDALVRAGRLLAKIHRIPAPKWLPSKERRLPRDAEAHMAGFSDREFVGWMHKQLEFVGTLTTGLTGPSGLVHGDYYPDNLVVRYNGELAVLDWETASDELLALDIGIAVVGLCRSNGRLAPASARKLISGYQDYRKMEPDELAMMRDVVVYSAIVIAYYRYYRHRIFRPSRSKACLYQEIPPFVESVYRDWPDKLL